MNSLVRAFFDLKFVTKYQLFDRISKSVHFSKQYSRYTRRKEISCFALCNRNSYDTLRDKIFAYQAFVLRGIHCIRGGVLYRCGVCGGGLGLVKIMGHARGFLRESISFFHLAENRILFHAGICLYAALPGNCTLSGRGRKTVYI